MRRWIVHAQTAFHATHALTSYRGAAEQAHEHHWRISIRASVGQLNNEGYAIDFHLLQQLLEASTGELHGADLNAHPKVGDPSPTAESLALHLAFELAPMVAELGGRLTGVSVWEGPENRVDLELEEPA